MPIYEFRCPNCEKVIEKVQPYERESPLCPNCQTPTEHKISPVAFVMIDGKGYPSRRKWMDKWTPDSSGFSTGSLHGEHY